ncbi:hypothetical protein KY321_02780, partial [Candidatus Woesearchaeota archaeon]|nr:hypothetical protein [Candidatus Woesearchaeota archaeon]
MGKADIAKNLLKDVGKKVADTAKEEVVSQATKVASNQVKKVEQGFNMDEQRAKLQSKINAAFNKNQPNLNPVENKTEVNVENKSDSNIADAENRIAAAQEEANKLKAEEIKVEEERVDVERSSSNNQGSSSSDVSPSFNDEIKTKNNSMEISANMHTTNSTNLFQMLFFAIILDVVGFLLFTTGSKFYELNIILDIPFIIQMKKKSGYYGSNVIAYLAIFLELIPFLGADVLPMYSIATGYAMYKYNRDAKDP